MSLTKNTPSSEGIRRHSLLARLCEILLHLMAVLIIAGLGAWALADLQSLELIAASIQAGVYATSSLTRCVLHLGISATLWAGLYLLGKRLLFKRDARKRSTICLGSGSGSVMTETIIVLPIALVLIFGIAQLALVNIATVIANAATYEATRSAWLWYPEIESNRMGGVTKAKVKEKARVQAASVLAVVAPGDYGLSSMLSSEAEQARGIFVASQFLVPGYDSGVLGKTLAKEYTDEITGKERSTSFTRGIDMARFIKRTPRKFDAAYAATKVTVDPFQKDGLPMLRVRVIYHHLCVMPMVASLFGQRVKVSGVDGYFLRIERVFERRQMLPPTDGWSQGETVSPIPLL